MLAWSPNDTLDLNYDRDRFVAIVSPGAEFSHWGPKAVLCERGGSHISFEDVRRITDEALSDTQNTILPGSKSLSVGATPEMSPAIRSKRQNLLALLESTAVRIREDLV